MSDPIPKHLNQQPFLNLQLSFSLHLMLLAHHSNPHELVGQYVGGDDDIALWLAYTHQ